MLWGRPSAVPTPANSLRRKAAMLWGSMKTSVGKNVMQLQPSIASLISNPLLSTMGATRGTFSWKDVLRKRGRAWEGWTPWSNVLANCHSTDTALAVMRLARSAGPAVVDETAGERGPHVTAVATAEHVPNVAGQDPVLARARKRLTGKRVARLPSRTQDPRESSCKRLCVRTCTAYEDTDIAAAICRLAAKRD